MSKYLKSGLRQVSMVAKANMPWHDDPQGEV